MRRLNDMHVLRTINKYTMNVFWAGGGYRIIVTRPDGSKVFDFAFDEERAWEIAEGHACTRPPESTLKPS